jgi:hypothetical protein
VISRKIEYGAGNAAMEAAKRSWANNLCNDWVNTVSIQKRMVALRGAFGYGVVVITPFCLTRCGGWGAFRRMLYQWKTAFLEPADTAQSARLRREAMLLSKSDCIEPLRLPIQKRAAGVVISLQPVP